MTSCNVLFWRDDIDSWHASCSAHKWASTDGNFNRGEVEYLAEVHEMMVRRGLKQAGGRRS